MISPNRVIKVHYSEYHISDPRLTPPLLIGVSLGFVVVVAGGHVGAASHRREGARRVLWQQVGGNSATCVRLVESKGPVDEGAFVLMASLNEA